MKKSIETGDKWMDELNMSNPAKEEKMKIVTNLNNYFMKINAEVKARNIYSALKDRNYSNPNVCSMFEKIEQICEDKDERFLTVVPKNTRLFRARKVNLERDNTDLGICIDENMITNGFNDTNSREAPIGISNAGRNNIMGMSYLYASSDIATACSEIKTDIRSVISIAEFEILEDMVFIDLNKDKEFTCEENEKENMSLGAFFTDFMFWFTKKMNDEEEYIPTQIIAEQFRKQGVPGLIYHSFYAEGKNYTIFDCGKNKVRYLDSRLVIHQYSDEVFWDYNNKCYLRSYVTQTDQNNLDIAKKQLKLIKESFESQHQKSLSKTD